ncbi:MAG: hypothetical protein NVS3B12_16110 [Acidimicrobiales bacterium]
MDNLIAKVAVVTGGASGIGRAMAERFAAEGMRVVIADVEATALAGAESALREQGADVVAVPTDVTDADSVQRLAEAAVAHFGAVHVICNNAGVGGHFGLSWETPLAEWKWLLDVNVWGVIHGIRSFVPLLIAQGEGHIVNTASLAGWGAAPTMGPYCATKHAVLAISESLRRELDALGGAVGVSVLCPGMVNTRIISSERNWPEDLGPEPVIPDDSLSTTVRQLLLEGTTTGSVDPPAAAAAALDGIRENRFVVTTHPAELGQAADRRSALARGGDFPLNALG